MQINSLGCFHKKWKKSKELPRYLRGDSNISLINSMITKISTGKYTETLEN